MDRGARPAIGSNIVPLRDRSNCLLFRPPLGVRVEWTAMSDREFERAAVQRRVVAGEVSVREATPLLGVGYRRPPSARRRRLLLGELPDRRCRSRHPVQRAGAPAHAQRPRPEEEPRPRARTARWDRARGPCRSRRPRTRRAADARRPPACPNRRPFPPAGALPVARPAAHHPWRRQHVE